MLVEDVHSSPLYADIRERWREEGTRVPIRSVIAMPFSLADARQSGVFFLRRGADEEPLKEDDVAFADTVVRAAVAAAHAVRFERGAGAVTGKDAAILRECRKRRGIRMTASALVHDLFVPMQTVALQAEQDAVRGAGFLARRVQVLHAHQPTAVAVTGIEKTRQGGNE